MAEEKRQATANGCTDRDAAGRFVSGNTAAKRRGRVNVDLPIPAELRQHDGVAVLWPLLAGLAQKGNGPALKLLYDIAVGATKPKPLGAVSEYLVSDELDVDEGYEEDDEVDYI